MAQDDFTPDAKPDDFVADDFTPDESAKDSSFAARHPILNKLFAFDPDMFKSMLESTAHPQSISDLASLMMPSTIGEIPKISKVLRPTKTIETELPKLPNVGDVQLPSQAAEVPKPQPKLLKSAPISLEGTKTKLVDVDSYLKPIQPEHHAAHLAEEAEQLKPIDIYTDEDIARWKQQEAEMIDEDIEDLKDKKIPNLKQIRDLIEEKKGLPKLSIGSRVNINPNVTSELGYAHPESPFAKPLSIQDPKFNSGYYGTGKPPELLHPNRLNPASEVIDDWKPSVDVQVNAQSETHPVESVMPKAGQAKSPRSKDISPFTANFTSADQTLASRPETAEIPKAIIAAQDAKMKFIASTERQLAQLSSGLDTEGRKTLGMLIDGQQVPNANPELTLRANKARQILDNIHAQFPEGATKAGEDVGYLENYFTHIQAQPDDIRSAVTRILDNHFGVLRSHEIPSSEAPPSGAYPFKEGYGKPSSPFVEERTGNVRNMQYDVNKVFPAYVESAAKVIFDKPAVATATKMLQDLPDSNLKELGKWYIRNYSNYDSLPGLHKAWSSWSNQIARTTARSLLGFNTGLQSLHLARIPANLWPELGSKYTLKGIQELASNPIASWHEAAELGLLQNEIRPMAFKTTAEKYDSVANFLSLADYLDKSIGYHGFKAKFLDEGLSAEEAAAKALAETKRVSLTVDPARMMKGYSPESNVLGGEVGSKLGGQFKQIPSKIIEQYTRIAAQARQNPKMATRLIGGVGIALAANEAGARAFHVSPYNLIPSSAMGPFGDMVQGVVKKLAAGNWQGALADTALWATPSGQSLKRQYNRLNAVP